MRPLAIALIMALGAAPAGAGDAHFSARIGVQAGGPSAQVGGFLRIGPTPIPQTKPPFTWTKPPFTWTKPPMPQTKPPGAAALERGAPRRRDLPLGPGKPHPHPHARHGPPFLFFDDDDEERIVVVPAPAAPAPPPAPPPEAEAAEPAPPPDPQGPVMLKARGAAAEAPFTVGAPLPDDVPHVTLDWRQYGLPRPPAGLVYARVRGNVLLIDPATRLVERRIDPSTLETAGKAAAPG